MAKSPPSSVHSSCRKAGMKDWEAVPLPILSLTASYHLPIPCGLTGKYPCGKGNERSKAKSPYWEPRHRSWLPPSDDRLSITDPVALFREIGWLCHRRIFIKQNRKVLYLNLLTSGKLNSYLVEIDQQAEDMFFRLVKQMAEREGVSETLKAENQMEWVQRINSIRNRAIEIVNTGIIYV